MPRNLVSIIVVLLFFCKVSVAQQEQGISTKANIAGRVFDANNGSPIIYANVVLLNSKDSSQVRGTTTDENGKFVLRSVSFGSYLLDVQFIGYEKKRIKIAVSSSTRNIDLGRINLKPSSVQLNDVLVEGKKPPMTYEIDKKVIDVDQMQTVTSGNAADILENIPSVSVDIDGNVSLRGSTNFTVLIDGRPSVMDAQDALQQIPASAIKSIELMTNPSAKYDAEGNAGIINIKLKKDNNLGLSGIVNANSGLNDKYGGGFLMQYKTPSLNYNFSIDYNRRNYPGTSDQQQQFLLNDNISYLNSYGSHNRNRESFGIRGGLDFNLGENNLISLGGRYGSRNGGRNSDLNYVEWSDSNPQTDFYFSSNTRSRDGSYYAVNLNYDRKYEDEGHTLSAEFFLSHNNSDELTLSAETQNGAQISGKKTTETGPSTEFRGKLDFALPFGENSKFETGAQGESDLSQDGNNYYEYNAVTGIYEFQPLFSNTTDYNRSELALYSIYSNEWGKLGFQGGVRGEYTYRNIDLMATNQSFSINRWDVFPTIHSSFKFEGGSQLMASYTRRIDRPHGWELEPFDTWMDANNVRHGNPSLQPEFIDSYEFGFQTFIGAISFSNDFYYKISHNKVEHVRSAYSDNVTLITFENVGQDYSLGTEFMLTFDAIPKIWDVNLTGDVYDYRINGVIFNEPFENKSFNWSTRFSNKITINSSTSLELNVRYNSPSVSSQGRQEGYFRTDAAIKKDLLDKKLSLTLQVRDLFRTGKWNFTSNGADYFSSNHFTREAPRVMLNVKFNFNDYQEKEQNNGNDEGIGNPTQF
jgi:outer membrane cobalamin receptor